MLSIIDKIKKRICKVEWQVAIRKRTTNELDFSSDKTEFIPIPNSSRYWAADPFLIDYKGKTLLFVELYDRLKRKGLLGYIDISRSVGDKYKIVYEADCHLSYPFVFVKDGILYAIPESNKCGKLILLQWDDISCKFELKTTFMEGMSLADSNFVSWKGVDYMLSTPIDHYDNISKLNIYKYIGNNKFKALKNNPVIDDCTMARNGGKIVSYCNEYYRISQDCGNGYGSGLNILHIDDISDDEYKESFIKKISPQDISISGIASIDGIHTYNSNDRYEVIDFKKNHKFSLVESIGFILCKIGIYKTKKVNVN